MVELLAGPLVGAAVADKLEAKNWGNLVLAVDPELLGDRDAIKARTQVSKGFVFAVLVYGVRWRGERLGARIGAGLGTELLAAAARRRRATQVSKGSVWWGLRGVTLGLVVGYEVSWGLQDVQHARRAAPTAHARPAPARRRARPSSTASSLRRASTASRRSCCPASAARASRRSGCRAA